MLSGKEKAKLLLSIIPEDSQDILTNLAPDLATLLTDTIEETPKVDADTHEEFLNEVIGKINEKKEALSSFSLTEEASSEALLTLDEIEPTEELDPELDIEGLRPIEDIALTLQDEENHQIVAFMLQNADEPLREKIESHLPLSLLDEIKELNVDEMPISSQIFNTLYNKIFMKEKEEVTTET